MVASLYGPSDILLEMSGEQKERSMVLAPPVEGLVRVARSFGVIRTMSVRYPSKLKTDYDRRAIGFPEAVVAIKVPPNDEVGMGKSVEEVVKVGP